MADLAVIGTWNAKAEGDDQAMLIDIKAAEGGIELVLRDPSSDGKDMTFRPDRRSRWRRATPT